MFSFESTPLAAPPAPATIRHHEDMEALLQKQVREKNWYAEKPAMESVADIQRQVAEGKAKIIPDEGEGYKVSDNVRFDFRVLNNKPAALLEHIARQWKQKAIEKGVYSEKYFLQITSLSRTVEHQKMLIEKGYPAAENSTHTKLGAFDIYTLSFSERHQELLEVLREVIAKLDQDEINVIEEKTIGALHIAVKPETLPNYVA